MGSMIGEPKEERKQEALAAEGHTLLYLPPYSPDLNPTEHKWAQIKALRRKVGGSIDTLFSNPNI